VFDQIPPRSSLSVIATFSHLRAEMVVLLQRNVKSYVTENLRMFLLFNGFLTLLSEII